MISRLHHLVCRLMYRAALACFLLLVVASPWYSASVSGDGVPVIVGVAMPGPVDPTAEIAEQQQQALAQQRKAVMDLALDDLHKGLLLGGGEGTPALSLGGGNVTLMYSDTSLEQGSMYALLDIRTRAAEAGLPLVAVIGSADSDDTTELSALSSAIKLPCLNPWVGAAHLSDPSAHPFHVRLSPNDENFAWALYKMLVKSSWFRVAVISLDDAPSRAVTDLLTNLMASHLLVDPTSKAFETQTFVIPASEHDYFVTGRTGVALDALLAYFLTVDLRIFVVIGGGGGSGTGADCVQSQIIMDLFEKAYTAGLMNVITDNTDDVSEQWIGLGWCEARTGITDLLRAAYTDPGHHIFTGLQCVAPPVPRMTKTPAGAVNPLMIAFQARLRALDPVMFPANYSITFEDVQAWNTIVVLGWALQTLFTESSFTTTTVDGLGLHTALYDVIANKQGQMRGIDGSLLQFTQPIGSIATELTLLPDPISSMDYLNWWPSANAHVTVGSYYPETHSANYSRLDVFMSDGSHVYSKDRARVYVDDDPMPKPAIDTQSVVLAYCLSVLGIWCSIILVEQAISAWAVQQKLRALKWNLLAAVCFGACSIWPTFILNLSAIELDTLSIYFRLDEFLVSAILLIPVITAFNCIGCHVEVTTRAKDHETRYGAKRGAAASGTDGSSKGSRGSRSHSQSASKSKSVSLLTELRQLTADLRSDFSVIINRIEWKLVVTMLVFSVVIMGDLALALDSLVTGARWSFPFYHYVVAVIFLWIVLTPSMVVIFHLLKSTLRYLVPFLLGGAFTASYFIVMDECTWVYSTTHLDANGNVFDSGIIHANSTLVLLVAVVSFLVVCASMLLNVNALRITKNVLDKVLSKVRNQVYIVEQQIAAEEKSRGQHEQSSRYTRRSIEVINLCRPLFRPYALAIALAEPAKVVQLDDTAVTVTKGATTRPSGVAKPKRTSGQESRSGSKATSVSNGKSPVLTQADPKSVASPPGERRRSQSGDATQEPLLSPAVAVPGTIEDVPTSDGGDALVTPSSPPTVTPTGGVVQVAPRPRAKIGGGSGGGAQSKSAALSLVNGSDFALVHATKDDAAVLAILKELRDFNFTDAVGSADPSGAAVFSPLSPLAVHSRVQADVRLPHLLSHPVTVELLKDVLSKQLSPENMAFWIDIQRYRSLESIPARRAVADDIHQLYISNGSRFEVNLSSHMKSNLETRMARGRMPLDMYDEVEREIFRLIGSNNLSELMSSPVWSKLAAIMLGQKDHVLRNVIPVQSGGTSVSVTQIVGYSQMVAPAAVRGSSVVPLSPGTVGLAGVQRRSDTLDPAVALGSRPTSRRPSADTAADHPAGGADATVGAASPLSPASGSGRAGAGTPTHGLGHAAHVARALQQRHSAAGGAGGGVRLTADELAVESRRFMYPGALSNVTGGADTDLEEEVDRMVNPGRESASLVNPGAKKLR